MFLNTFLKVFLKAVQIGFLKAVAVCSWLLKIGRWLMAYSNITENRNRFEGLTKLEDWSARKEA